jgi:hypothetical protein
VVTGIQVAIVSTGLFCTAKVTEDSGFRPLAPVVAVASATGAAPLVRAVCWTHSTTSEVVWSVGRMSRKSVPDCARLVMPGRRSLMLMAPPLVAPDVMSALRPLAVRIARSTSDSSGGVATARYGRWPVSAPPGWIDERYSGRPVT